MQAPMVFADEGIAGISALWNGGEGETRVELRGQVLEGVHGEVDAASEESVFDLLDEDAFGVEGGAIGEGGRDDEGGVLHTVADGADDLDFYGVAEQAKLRRDMVGLPKRELRAARADTNGLSTHDA